MSHEQDTWITVARKQYLYIYLYLYLYLYLYVYVPCLDGTLALDPCAL